MCIHNIKLYAKNEKNCNKSSDDIERRYRDSIWHRKICYAYSEKQKTVNVKRIRTTKTKKKNQIARKKSKLINT